MAWESYENQCVAKWHILGDCHFMNVLLHSLPDLIRFIKGTIYYRILHNGPGDFSRRANVISINSYRFSVLPGRRRLGMQKKAVLAKVIVL